MMYLPFATGLSKGADTTDPKTFLRYLKLITQIPVARFKILKLLHTISGNYQQKEIMTIKKSNRRIFLFTYFSPWFKQTARLNIESTWNIMGVGTFWKLEIP